MTVQRGMQLAAADIDGPHARRAALQQAIRESAGGRSHVKTYASSDIDSEMIDRGRELPSSAAHVRHGLKHFDAAGGIDAVSRLVAFLSVDHDLPGDDQRAGFLARRYECALEQELKVPLFHRHARGLVLTEQGELLLRTAREVMAKPKVREVYMGMPVS